MKQRGTHGVVYNTDITRDVETAPDEVTRDQWMHLISRMTPAGKLPTGTRLPNGKTVDHYTGIMCAFTIEGGRFVEVEE